MKAVLVIAACGMILPAASWEAFVEECLAPFERYAPVSGTAFELETGGALGARVCTWRSAQAGAGFEAWRDEALRTGRYVMDGSPLRLVSNEWAEPVIAVERIKGGVRVIETGLES